MDPQRREALSGLALALAAGLCLAWPPEVHPLSGFGAGLLLALGIVVSPHSFPRMPLFVGLALVAFNLVTSAAPGRGVDVAVRLALGVLTFALATRVAGERRLPIYWVVALVGGALGLYAAAQSIWLLDHAALAAREAALPDAWAIRLETGRPFATHVVPAALGGALVLALASCFAAWPRTASRGARALLVFLACSSLTGLLLTLSIGALGGAFGGIVLLAIVSWRRLPRRALVAACAALLVAVALFAVVRPETTLSIRDPGHPLVLRAGNWRGALLAATRAPISGIGLGAYRSLYPAYRRPGDSETAYAHNSWLQLAAEGGLPMLALLGAGAGAFWRRRRRPFETEELALFAASGAFLVHNVVDFTAYLPGVLVPAAALGGLLFHHRREGADAEAGRRDGGGRAALALIAATLALVSLAQASAPGLRAYLVAPEEDRARHPGRAASLAAASSAAPWNSAILLDVARVLARDAAREELRGALDLAERARRLDPWSPEPWHLLGDLQLEAGSPSRAWRAYAQASSRHPADGEVREKRDRLAAVLRDAGMLDSADAYPRLDAEGPADHPWTRWDDILLLAGLGLCAPLAYRRWRGGPAPPESLALGLSLLVVIWGEGGALPGVRVAWGLLVALALLLALFPRRDPAEEGPALPGAPLLWLAPALVVAALGAALSPDRAAARDGLVVGLLLFAALLVSHGLAQRFAAWPRTLSGVVVAVSAVAGAFWVLQRVMDALGAPLAFMPAPFHAGLKAPLAGDFLHPGHLGTLLVAAGFLVLVPRLAEARRRSWPAWIGGGVFLALGASSGARATLLALLAALALGSLLSLPARLRRALIAALVVGALLACGAVAWRFASVDDPYAWSRVKIWQAAAGALWERPWSGYGPSAFGSRAAAYAPEESSDIARYGKVFRSPHSDLLGSLLALGIPGALLLWFGLGRLFLRALLAARQRAADHPELAGIVIALTVLGTHGLVDDILVARPATGLIAALLLGAAAGRAAGEDELVRCERPIRLTLAVATLVVLLSGLIAPWLADRVMREGEPRLAARIDPARWSHWTRASRSSEGDGAQRLTLSLYATSRAIDVAPSVAGAWRERARVLDRACSGILAERDTCADARRAWSRAIEAEPIDVFALRARALLDARLGDLEAARHGFEEAIAIEPNFLGARLDLARALEQLGDTVGARREREEVIARRERLRGSVVQSLRDGWLVSLERTRSPGRGAAGGAETP